MCAIEEAGWEIRDTLMWVYGSGFPKSKNLDGDWEGWGTALKPAWEPIVLARKPFKGSVGSNVAQHGTGAMNIDACRVPTIDELRAGAGGTPCRHDESNPRGRNGQTSAARRYDEVSGTNFAMTPGPRGGDAAGRWPANLLHDGSEDVVGAFPSAPGQQRVVGPEHGAKPSVNAFGDFGPREHFAPRGDAGSAARFFYCAKATREDRDDGLDGLDGKTTDDGRSVTANNPYQRGATVRQNHHPTVKPTALMRWLCRLVTPVGGVIVDPFTGSGSTGRGAIAEGFEFVGIELDEQNADIARRRIAVVQPGLPLAGAPT